MKTLGKTILLISAVVLFALVLNVSSAFAGANCANPRVAEVNDQCKDQSGDGQGESEQSATTTTTTSSTGESQSQGSSGQATSQGGGGGKKKETEVSYDNGGIVFHTNSVGQPVEFCDNEGENCVKVTPIAQSDIPGQNAITYKCKVTGNGVNVKPFPANPGNGANNKGWTSFDHCYEQVKPETTNVGTENPGVGITESSNNTLKIVIDGTLEPKPYCLGPSLEVLAGPEAYTFVYKLTVLNELTGRIQDLRLQYPTQETVFEGEDGCKLFQTALVNGESEIVMGTPMTNGYVYQVVLTSHIDGEKSAPVSLGSNWIMFTVQNEIFHGTFIMDVETGFSFPVENLMNSWTAHRSTGVWVAQDSTTEEIVLYNQTYGVEYNTGLIGTDPRFTPDGEVYYRNQNEGIESESWSIEASELVFGHINTYAVVDGDVYQIQIEDGEIVDQWLVIQSDPGEVLFSLDVTSKPEFILDWEMLISE